MRRYEAVGSELLREFDMDGLEMGLVEVSAPEFTDPWIVQDEEMDSMGEMNTDATLKNKNKAEKFLDQVST